MADGKGIIPLYLNSDMAKNILTVILFEVTIKKQSISIKDQLKVNIKTPLNELAYNAFGQHMQGEVSLEAASEFVNQFSQETINGDVLVFLKARDALRQQNLIKSINSESDLNKLKANDYVEFSCELKPNPAIEQVENIINMLEMQRVLNLKDLMRGGGESNAMHEMLSLLKNNLEQYKKEKCLRFVGDNIGNSSSGATIPIQSKCMIDNMDYMLSGKAGVVGKVVNVEKDRKNQGMHLLKGTCFEHFTEKDFEDIIDRFLPNASKESFRESITMNNNAAIDVLPIMIYV